MAVLRRHPKGEALIEASAPRGRVATALAIVYVVRRRLQLGDPLERALADGAPERAARLSQLRGERFPFATAIRAGTLAAMVASDALVPLAALLGGS